MKCRECKAKMLIRKNDSTTQTLPFTIRCSKCRKWWDISKTKASQLLDVPYNMVSVLV